MTFHKTKVHSTEKDYKTKEYGLEFFIFDM